MKSEAGKTKHLGVMIDSYLVNKFYYVSKYYGRSGRKQLEYLLRTLVDNFEREHGGITDEELKASGLVD